MWRARPRRIGRLALPLLLIGLGGCSGVDWTRIDRAAEQAARDPLTWGSAGGAVLFLADGARLDRRLSDWAQEHTPLFGSRSHALEMSDRLRDGANSAVKLAALLEPTPEQGEAWLWRKGEVLVYEAFSSALTTNTTGMIKRSTGRQRPGGSSSFDSFPSAHSSAAFNDAVHGHHHVQRFNLTPINRNLLSGGFFVLAGGTAWARVEGGVHYPSDVLAGAALGNFFALFIDGLLIHPSTKKAAGVPPLRLLPTAHGALLWWHRPL